MKTMPWRSVLAVCCSVLLAHNSWSLSDGDGTGNDCNDYNIYRNPYFGDTHVHTTFSVDAYTQGVETTPEQAYRFARGEQIGLHPFDENGVPLRQAQLERPLDFAMVSDHAEFFGEQSLCLDPANPIYSGSDCQLLRQRDGDALIGWNVLLGAQPNNVRRFDFCGPDGGVCVEASKTTWQRMIDAAEAYYDRSADCEFTTFIGYEWTGAPTQFNDQGQLETLNLHRNVLFRNSLVPEVPATYLDAPYPQKLWRVLQDQCISVVDGSNRCNALTIPHNSNLSQGLMFETVQFNGAPYSANTARDRAKFEPLIEVMQHKGQSECLPTAGDELCDYEIIPWGHLAGNFIGPTAPRPEGFVRAALKKGLTLQDAWRANPFKYGFIGSTDTHLGTPGLVEDIGYPGHGGAAGGADGQAVRTGITDTPEFNPGGLAVVWATQNSRAALFDAMKRREVYATSGPRHIVRFYGAWDLPADICALPNRTEVAFNTAVPMGGTLPAPGAGQSAPYFMVSAMKDAGTASAPGNDLQRIQIVKGWTDALGAEHEKVFEVAGDPDKGAGVNTGTCETTGAGFAELCQLWQDPEFDRGQNAFYYARVVENPSCRWTQRQCIAAEAPIDCASPETVPEEYAACCDADIPQVVQERSWTSPIWYNVPPPGC